ncbi:hypothetical protein Adt_06358 [Abeliophyllum distichum]|uniref:Uncharacterized protein n=1 Tax=Abeliophyllum distichum TaxID=126358 RepID=A0ABD1V6N8_9LAMI
MALNFGSFDLAKKRCVRVVYGRIMAVYSKIVRGFGTNWGWDIASSFSVDGGRVANPRLAEVRDPFISDPIRWAAMDVPPIMVEEDMSLLRKSYRISSDIGLMIPEPNEQACFPRRGHTVLHLHAFVVVLGDGQLAEGSRRPRARVGCSKKVIEELSREGNREEAEAPDVVEIENTNASEVDVHLTRKRKAGTSGVGSSSRPKGKAVEVVYNYAVSQNPGSPAGGPYDSKKKVRELIGASGLRILDDALRNVPFYPSMGAQVVKKYFTPEWEEFATHRDLEDVLEASLAAAIRASAMQLKVLGEFRTRMQEHKKLVAEATKSDKEHRQALEGLQATMDSMRIAYEHLQANLREFESNVLNLSKQLDNANAAQKVAAEALEAANKEKRRLLDEAKSHEQETQSLRENLEVAKKWKKEAEAEVARLLGEKKEMKAKLGNVEAEFVANFHNTEAYTNFSDYSAKVGHQEVLTVLRIDHPSIDLGPLEARFLPPDVEGEEEWLELSFVTLPFCNEVYFRSKSLYVFLFVNNISKCLRKCQRCIIYKRQASFRPNKFGLRHVANMISRG